jgi:octaprenyl-diphosphate synthase
MNIVDKPTRRKLIYIIKNHNKDSEKIKYIINKVVEAGGIQYATQKMNAYRDDALKILYEFKDTDTRKGLEELVRFTTDRKY